MHSQNLRDNPHARETTFFKRRGWADRWRWELCLYRPLAPFLGAGRTIGFDVQAGGEDPAAVGVSVNLLWLFIHLTFHRALPKRWEIGWYTRTVDGKEVKNPRWFDDSMGRNWGFYLFETHLVFRWNSAEQGNHGPGFYWSIFVDEFFLGRNVYTTRHHRKHSNVDIYFPEGLYHLDIDLFEGVWTRKRFPFWPFAKTIQRAKVKVVEKGGIPKPGKGENSWDCGDDATYSITGPAKSVHEAIEMIRATVLRQRRRYGGGEAMYAKRKAQA